jgi:tripartite-type tricarboxylate transporter receptor subunit TctC
MATNARALTGWILAAIASTAACTTPVLAQSTYPARPIRVIVPLAPGGGSDVTTRYIGARLAERVGQPIVVDNRPAASGIVGTDVVAKAAPDGYTLLSAFSTHAQSAQLFAKLPYDPIADFAPVSMISSTPLVMSLHVSVPSTTVKDFIAYAKENAGKLNYGSSGPGSSPHLATELFNSMAGLRMTHIPYKGSGPFIAAQLGNEIQVSFSSIVTIAPHAKAGRLRLLASGGAKRSAAIPDVPTIAESGLPGFEAIIWYGILAPAKTSPAIVERLQREIAAIVRSPEGRQYLVSQGNDAVGDTPAEFAAFMRAEADKWGAIGKRLGVRLD